MARKGVGQALMVVGAIIVAAALLFPQQIASGLATVTIDTLPPEFPPARYSPYAPNPDSPARLPSSGTLQIWADPEDESDIVSVWCVVTRPGDSIENRGMSWEGWAWVGQVEMTGEPGLWIFEFHAKDEAGNEGTAVSYGHVSDVEGEFYINNNGPLTETSELLLATRDLEFKFVPLSGAESIDRVYIIISQDGSFWEVELTEGPENWIGNWTAPGDGVYEIRGYYMAFGQTYQAMSLTIGLGDGEEPTPTPYTDEVLIVLVIGSALCCIGAVVAYGPKGS